MSTNATISRIHDLLSEYQVNLLSKKADIYDVVSQYLEKTQTEHPFFVVNIGDIIKQYENWVTYLPHIRPYYAIKCNPDPLIVKILHRLGCGFDCASENEIKRALDAGASPDEIIFANPCKMNSMITFANTHGVAHMTFDCDSELIKIKKHHPKGKLVIRIITDSSHSLFNLSAKFGCTLDEGKELMKMAKGLELEIAGVSFHVGSGCSNPSLFDKAIADAKVLFNLGKELGFDMNLLDIGGGFPGRDVEGLTLEIMANHINTSIEKHFSDYPDIKIISEPGRYFVTSSHTLVTSVVNKKLKVHPTTKEPYIVYYLNDGTFNSFFNIPMDHYVLSEENTLAFSERSEKKHKCRLFGPTTELIDLISEEIMLPDLDVGEYIMNIDMGAYSVAVNTGTESFNGFNKTQIFYYLN